MKAVVVCMNHEIKIVDVLNAEAERRAVSAFSAYLLSNYQCSIVKENSVPLPNQYGISCISDDTGTFEMNSIATEFCKREIRGDCIIACIHHRAGELFGSRPEDLPQSVIDMLMEIAARYSENGKVICKDETADRKNGAVDCKDKEDDAKEEHEPTMREKAIAHGRANLNLLRGIDGVNDVIRSFDGDKDIMKSVLREAGIVVE